MIPIVILAGQSNMLGHGQLSDIEGPPLPPEVKLFDLNPRDGFFGPEVGFARSFTEHMKLDNLWLIKYAVGGSSLLAWEPNWSAERAALTGDADKGPLYQRLIRHFAQVKSGSEVQVVACLWMQGESDSRFQKAAAQYKSNLTRLIAQMRADSDQSEMKFVIGLANPPQATFDYASVVREAQASVSRTVPNVSLFDTDGLTKHEDDLHYDSAGQIELGRRFAHRLHQDLCQRHNR